MGSSNVHALPAKGSIGRHPRLQRDIPPNAARQLFGGCLSPASLNRGLRQMYQSRWGLSSEERELLNHSCCLSSAVAMRVLRSCCYLVGGVVDHQVQYTLHPPLMKPSDEIVDVLYSPVGRMDIAIVGNVVSHVDLRRLEDCFLSTVDHISWVQDGLTWTKPYGVDSHILQVIELVDDATNVTPTIAVAVLKRGRVNLINGRLFPPAVLRSALGMLHHGDCHCAYVSRQKSNTECVSAPFEATSPAVLY